MCFSAEASFGAGIVLSLAGISSIRKAKDKSHIAFAAIPLIFAVQQFSEGFLWFSLMKAEYAMFSQLFKYIFLFFGLVFWPAWIPFSLVLLEKESKRRKILIFFFGVGLSVSLIYIYCLTKYPVSSNVIAHHIKYKLDIPLYIFFPLSIVYFIPAVISLFFSSAKKTSLLGWMLIATYLIQVIFFNGFTISIWCYFAALISIIIFWITAFLEKE